jgi:hypothetical protein
MPSPYSIRFEPEIREKLDAEVERRQMDSLASLLNLIISEWFRRREEPQTQIYEAPNGVMIEVAFYNDTSGVEIVGVKPLCKD